MKPENMGKPCTCTFEPISNWSGVTGPIKMQQTTNNWIYSHNSCDVTHTNDIQWCFSQQQFMYRERTNHRYKIMIRSGTNNVHVQEHIYCLDAIWFRFYTWFTLGIVFVGHVTPVDSVGYVGVMSDCHRCVAEPLTKHQIANSIPWSLHIAFPSVLDPHSPCG